MKKVLCCFVAILTLFSFASIFNLDVDVNAASKTEIQAELLRRLYNGAGGYVSCDFDGYVNTSGRHEGIDFKIGSGYSVYAVADGEVTSARTASSGLSTIAIYNSTCDVTVIYLHTKNIAVSAGTTVHAGQKIAVEGNAGTSAVHTHVELRTGRRTSAAVSVGDYTLDNPNPYSYYEKLLNIKPSPNPVHTRDTAYGTEFSATANSRIDVFNADHSDPGNYYIDAGDKCTIHEVYTDGCCKVTYPSSASPTGERTYYAPIQHFTPAGSNPIGAVDSVWGGEGFLHVRGWAFDADNTAAQLNIHVYIGDEGHGWISANKERTDVNNVYGCGNYHGYDENITTSKTGWQTIEIYAINVGGGGNVLLHKESVYIAPVPTYDFDVNMVIDDAVHMSGSSGFTFDLYLNGSRVSDDATDYATSGMTNGTSFEIKDIKCPSGYVFTGGTTSGTVTSSTDIRLKFTSQYALDVNPKLNGTVCSTGYSGFTYDVYLNGSLAANDVIDFYQVVNRGTKYELKDFKCPNGYSYTSGAISGTVNSAVTLTPAFNANTYTVTFNANGGSTPTSSKSVTYNSTYGTLPTPTRTGYTFNGWYTAASGGTKITSSSTVSTAGNHTLYARWTANTYTVTFNANGGSCSTSSKNVTYNSTYGSLPTPARTGYTFNGWYTAASGGTKITSSSTVSTANNHTLYAQWSINTYTITYNPNGGSGAPVSQKVTHGTTATLSSTIPTKSGYMFMGWATSSTAASAMYSAGDTYSSNSSVTLYAVWEYIDGIISENNYYKTPISEAGAMNYLSFTPSTSGKYVIYSTGSDDTKVYLYNTNGTQIATNDDGGENRNFRLTYDMTAGTTYIFGLKYYSSSKTGEILFKIGNVYNISYNANGGADAPSAQTKDYGTAITLSSTVPTRTGYTFLGWATSSTATSATYSAGGTYSVNADATLYAVWKANTYSVKYNANGGAGTPAVQTKTYGTDLTLSSTVPTRTGYTFLGWASSSTATVATYSAGGTYSANESTTLYAVWEKNTYTVQFNANGGEGAPEAQIKTHGTTLKLSTTVPTRAGYTFRGWATSSSATSSSYSAGSNYTSNANITLYAVWSAHTYTVYYNANGGSGYVSSSSHTYGTAKALTTNSFTRAGYKFLGWAKTSNATVAEYTNGQAVTDLTPEKYGSITLYAVWQSDMTSVSLNSTNTATISNGGDMKYFAFTPSESGFYVIYSTGSNDTKVYLYNDDGIEIGYNDDGGDSTNFRLERYLYAGDTYTFGVRYYSSSKTGDISFKFGKVYNVYYSANGGKDAPSTQYKDYGKNLILRTTVPTKSGYTCQGWSTSPSSASITYSLGSTYSANADLTLYAVWKANTYYVKYDANGGKGTMSNSTHTFGVSKALTANTFTRTGYTFLGWARSKSATTPDYVDGRKVSGLTGVSGRVVNLYAVWKANSYTVKYHANGGTGTMADSGFTYGVEQTLRANSFTRTGYIFKGWKRSTSATTAMYTDAQTVKNLLSKPNNTLTLYAVWEPITYSVKYNANGGKGTMANSAHTFGTAKALTANTFTRTGYTFLGWSKTKNATTASYVDCKEVSGLTGVQGKVVNLYAVWKANNYTVKYHANGGKGTMADSGFTYGVEQALRANSFTRTGYIFKGWKRSTSATTAMYTDAQTVKNLLSKPDNTLTLYAVWEPINYSVKYDANGGTGTMSNSAHTFGTAKALSANKFTRTGYTFLGWSKTKNATTASYVDCKEVSGLTGVDGKTVVLYAVWKKN